MGAEEWLIRSVKIQIHVAISTRAAREVLDVQVVRLAGLKARVIAVAGRRDPEREINAGARRDEGACRERTREIAGLRRQRHHSVGLLIRRVTAAEVAVPCSGESGRDGEFEYRYVVRREGRRIDAH